MTRKDFEAIAKILGEHGASIATQESLADYFTQINPRFNRATFANAIIKARNDKWQVNTRLPSN